MIITMETAPRKFTDVSVLEDLPEIGRPLHTSLISAAEVKSLEPFPYSVPQRREENYKYAVWRIFYRPDNLTETHSSFIAVPEPDFESL